MAGRPYSMREMRAIVEYLNERKAYKETKGRKMWMEFANSNRTERTWQSLKETFLKRILPDIQNPYYKLTRDQVRSFKEGEDVTEREMKNRLIIRTGNNSNGVVHRSSDDQNELSTAIKDSKMPATSHENEPSFTTLDEELQKVTGEDIKAAKTPSSRSFTETGYRNAEDVQKVLESPEQTIKTKSKSLKDKLIFEPPFSPLALDILNDFETESETSDSECRLQIAEDLPKANTESEAMAENVLDDTEKRLSKSNAKDNTDDCTIEIHDIDTLDSVGKKNNPLDKETTEISKDLQTDSYKPNNNKNVNSHDINETNSNCKNPLQPNDVITDSQIEIHDTDTSDSVGKKNNTLYAETTEISEYQQTKSDKPHDSKNVNSNEINETNSNCKIILQAHDGITNTESNNENTTEVIMVDSTNSDKSTVTAKDNTDYNNSIIANTVCSTQITTFDSLLPCNQEALDHKTDEQKAKQDKNGAATINVTKKENKPSQKANKKRKKRESSARSNETDDGYTVEIHDSSSPTFDTKSLRMKTTLNKAIRENPTTNDREEQSSVKQLSDNEPSRKAKEDNSKTKENDGKDTTMVREENLCQQNDNLFQEQFRNPKHSENNSVDVNTQSIPTRIEQTKCSHTSTQKQNISKSENTDLLKEKENIPQENKRKNTEVSKKELADLSNEVTLVEDNKNKRMARNSNSSEYCELQTSTHLDKSKDLANLFGFAHGGVPINRKRRSSHRRRSHHRRRYYSNDNGSHSSEWTSDNGSDTYVSPPRGSRSGHTKNYLEPRSSRVLEIPEEGRLYVLFGKRIYPIVKNTKDSKNFVTYHPFSDSDEEESLWKEKCLKYKRLLKELTKKRDRATSERTSDFPVELQNEPTTRKSLNTVPNGDNITKTPEVEHKQEEKKIIISIRTFEQNRVEHVVEGPWNEVLNTVSELTKVNQTANVKVQLMHVNEGMQLKPDAQVAETSRSSTPSNTVDIDVHEKMKIKEGEIFSEIEKLHQETETENANVTKRRGRPRKQSLQAPAKRARSSASNSNDSRPKTKSKRVSRSASKPIETIEKISSEKIPAVGSRTSTRVLRTPKKFEGDPRPSEIKLQTAKKIDLSPQDEDEDQPRYKFPSAKDKKKFEKKNRR